MNILSNPIRALIAGCALALAVAGRAAETPGVPAAPPAEGKKCAARVGGPEATAQRLKYVEGRLDALHGALKLAPAQEAAWTSFSNTVKEQIRGKEDARPDFAELSKKPAPERIAQWLAFTKDKTARLEVGLAATQSFYEGLTAEQKRSFDEQFNLLWPHHGRKHARPGAEGN